MIVSNYNPGMTSITGSRDAISASFKSRVRVSLRLTSGRNCEHPGNVARKIVGQRQHQQKTPEILWNPENEANLIIGHQFSYKISSY